MKKLLFLFAIVLLSSGAFAQTAPLPDFSVSMEDTSVYKDPKTNAAALKAANYLLSTPLDNSNENRKKCTQMILLWMTNTPDYAFSVDTDFTKFVDEDQEMAVPYLVAMAKYALENKKYASDDKKVKMNGLSLLAKYLKDPKHNVKLTNGMKKLIKADETGKLAEYVKG